jgi:hypothetical protein
MFNNRENALFLLKMFASTFKKNNKQTTFRKTTDQMLSMMENILRNKENYAIPAVLRNKSSSTYIKSRIETHVE